MTWRVEQVLSKKSLELKFGTEPGASYQIECHVGGAGPELVWVSGEETVSEKRNAIRNITKTCLYNFDPLKPHFYIVKLGFKGVYNIFLISALTVRIGMLFHSSINAFLSCARVAGGFRRFLTLLSSSSHMCSIGVKSGLYGGHASGAMLLFARKCWQTRATCGRALSCCRIRLRCCTSGTATGRKISSLYLTAVILPATIINCDFIPWAMPPQTITEPPPKPIPFDNTGVGKAFSATSVHTTSTICDREWT